MQVNRPIPITQFFDTLQASGDEIIPDSLIWVPDPNHPGRKIWAVQTRPTGEAPKPVTVEQPGRWVIEKRLQPNR